MNTVRKLRNQIYAGVNRSINIADCSSADRRDI
jgi:hypothetical protein